MTDVARLLPFYGITFDAQAHNDFNRSLFASDGDTRRFRNTDTGIVPFYLVHRKNSHIESHRHLFFELTLVVNGRAWYTVDGERVAVSAGDILLMSHRRRPS